LKRPQQAFLTALAGGYSPIYPCHIKPRDMRQRPIGTGPYKFVEFKPNERITVTRNPDYWKAGRPYLDGIEYTIIRNQSTATLAFVAGKFDMTFLYSLEVPLLRDVKSQMPQAICELVPLGISRILIVNRDVPPFDNPDLRQAMAPCGVHQHNHRRAGRHRRGHATSARRTLGHAAGHAEDAARL
jgi:peptide/nickel transport system substrate-binding protein